MSEDATENNFYIPEGDPNAGKIADVEKARELATVEDEAGQKARISAEKRLLAEHKAGGLTELQRENVAIMDGLVKAYPHALKDVYDSQGRRMVAQVNPEGDEHFLLVINQDRSAVLSTTLGFLSTTLGFVGFSNLIPSSIIDVLSDATVKLPEFKGQGVVAPVVVDIKKADGTEVGIGMSEVDLRNPNIAGWLKNSLKFNDQQLASRAEARPEAVGDVLARLTGE